MKFTRPELYNETDTNRSVKTNDEIIKEYQRVINHWQDPILNYDKYLTILRNDFKELEINYQNFFLYCEQKFRFNRTIKKGFFKDKELYQINYVNHEKARLFELAKKYSKSLEKIETNQIVYDESLDLFNKKIIPSEDKDFVNLNLPKLIENAFSIVTPLGVFTEHLTFKGIDISQTNSQYKQNLYIWDHQCTDDTLSFFTEFLRTLWRVKSNLPLIFSKFGVKKFYEIRVDYYEKQKRKYELQKRRKETATKKIENVGYVYVLSNKAYPNIYKIGSTYGNADERAEELTGTGHLMPFKVETKIKIKSAEYYEKKIHSVLNSYRVKQNREFFELDLNKIKSCLKTLSQITDKGEKKLSLSDLKKRIVL